jgi:hypothetical protein
MADVGGCAVAARVPDHREQATLVTDVQLATPNGCPMLSVRVSACVTVLA